MLLHDLVRVDVPMATAQDRLLGPDRNGWTTLVSSSGAELDGTGRLHVGRPTDRSWFAKTLQVELGPPIARAADLIVEFTVSPIGLRSLFPSVMGAIEMNPAGACGTQLAVHGRYRPPLGTFGRMLDRTLAHHLAQRVLHALLQEVAARLSYESRNPSPGLELEPERRGRSKEAR
ncbi:MAG: hypothetical protein ACRDYC_10060 [Acidimicrobiales bacterium]